LVARYLCKIIKKVNADISKVKNVKSIFIESSKGFLAFIF